MELSDLGLSVQPPPSKGSYDWTAIAAALRDHPQRWILTFQQERYSLVVALRNGSIAALRPALGFRTTTRRNTRTKPRLCDLYIMYDPDLDTTLVPHEDREF
jgi:hypothetical protein